MSCQVGNIERHSCVELTLQEEPLCEFILVEDTCTIDLQMVEEQIVDLILEEEITPCVFTLEEQLCEFTLTCDCEVSEMVYVRVSPTSAVWVSDVYVATFEVEANTEWNIV